MKATLAEIAKLVQGEVSGTDKITISKLCPIDNILPDSLVFAEGEQNLKLAQASKAAAILVSNQTGTLNKPAILVSNPLKAFITLLNHFYPMEKPDQGIHKTAVIAKDAKIGNNVSIGPYVIIESGVTIGDKTAIKGHVSIGKDATIGRDCTLNAHVAIYDNCQIGNRVAIHASSVIGCDGFRYTQDNGKHLKLPHVGNVVIEDDVEVGANTVIDRATMGSTVIGEGTKIDNFVQVAHSVKLGKHNILCAFTGIAGSTQSGNHVVFAANVGVSDHVKIEDGVILGARTGVPPKKHLKQGNVYLGNPARPKEKAIELELGSTRIPIMRKTMRSLTEKVKQLEKQLQAIEKE